MCSQPAPERTCSRRCSRQRVPAGHVEGMYRTGSLNSVEVPPANAICMIVPPNHLQPRPLVVLQAVRACLAVDPKRRKFLGSPFAAHRFRKRRQPARCRRGQAFQLVAQEHVSRRFLAPRAPEIEPIDVVGDNEPGERFAPGVVLTVNQHPRVGRKLRVIPGDHRVLFCSRRSCREASKQAQSGDTHERCALHGPILSAPLAIVRPV